MRCGFGAQLVKQLAHSFALEFGIPQDRGAASDVGVLLFDLRCSTSRYPWCDLLLEGKRDEVVVGEKVLEEVVDFGNLKPGENSEHEDLRALNIENVPLKDHPYSS